MIHKGKRRIMDNLRAQIFKLTDGFVGEIAELARQHTETLFSSAFAHVAGGSPRGRAPRPARSASRGAKRDAGEIEATARRFAAFVESHPGLRIEQINQGLGTTTKDLALPIRKLIADGKITSQGQKRSTTYFAGKSVPAKSEAGSRSAKAKSGPAKVKAKAGRARNARAARRAGAKARVRSKGGAKSRPAAAAAAAETAAAAAE